MLNSKMLNSKMLNNKMPKITTINKEQTRNFEEVWSLTGINCSSCGTKEEWSLTEIFCPSCGTKGVWTCPYYGDWETGAVYACVKCNCISSIMMGKYDGKYPATFPQLKTELMLIKTENRN